MKKIVVYVVVLFMFNSCCSWKAWIGYKKPNPSDYVEIENSPIKIGIQNLNAVQENTIREASAQVFEIFNSTEFRQRVESQRWLASCNLKPNGEKDYIEGKDVFSELINNYVDFSVNPRKPCAAIAQTQKHQTKHFKNRIAIQPQRIQKWESSDLEEKSLLINTIAHEITHSVSFKFLDKGHGTANCPDKELVSYGIGNLVADIWLRQ